MSAEGKEVTRLQGEVERLRGALDSSANAHETLLRAWMYAPFPIEAQVMGRMSPPSGPFAEAATAIGAARQALSLISTGGGGSAQSQPCGEASGKPEVFAGLGAEPSAAFDLRQLAEVATKAIYTHGFGFREVVGPSRHRNSQYVNFCWDDEHLVRAIFTLHPDETPAKGGAS